MSPVLKRTALAVCALAALAMFSLNAPRIPANATEPSTAAAAGAALDTAIFASGCFWCTESDFEKVPGVVRAVSGYTGGHVANPDYGIVGQGRSGHTEAVEVTFDPARVSYETLVEHYWRTTDVVDNGGQFCDRGSQYRPGIFPRTPEQKDIAEKSKAAIDKSGILPSPIAVEITAASKFYPAEGYHQDYYKTNTLKYHFYRQGCGRDARLNALWGKQAGH